MAEEAVKAALVRLATGDHPLISLEGELEPTGWSSSPLGSVVAVDELPPLPFLSTIHQAWLVRESFEGDIKLEQKLDPTSWPDPKSQKLFETDVVRIVILQELEEDAVKEEEDEGGKKWELLAATQRLVKKREGYYQQARVGVLFRFFDERDREIGLEFREWEGKPLRIEGPNDVVEVLGSSPWIPRILAHSIEEKTRENAVRVSCKPETIRETENVVIVSVHFPAASDVMLGNQDPELTSRHFLPASEETQEALEEAGQSVTLEKEVKRAVRGLRFGDNSADRRQRRQELAELTITGGINLVKAQANASSVMEMAREKGWSKDVFDQLVLLLGLPLIWDQASHLVDPSAVQEVQLLVGGRASLSHRHQTSQSVESPTSGASFSLSSSSHEDTFIDSPKHLKRTRADQTSEQRPHGQAAERPDSLLSFVEGACVPPSVMRPGDISVMGDSDSEGFPENIPRHIADLGMQVLKYKDAQGAPMIVVYLRAGQQLSPLSPKGMPSNVHPNLVSGYGFALGHGTRNLTVKVLSYTPAKQSVRGTLWLFQYHLEKRELLHGVPITSVNLDRDETGNLQVRSEMTDESVLPGAPVHSDRSNTRFCRIIFPVLVGGPNELSPVDWSLQVQKKIYKQKKLGSNKHDETHDEQRGKEKGSEDADESTLHIYKQLSLHITDNASSKPRFSLFAFTQDFGAEDPHRIMGISPPLASFADKGQMSRYTLSGSLDRPKGKGSNASEQVQVTFRVIAPEEEGHHEGRWRFIEAACEAEKRDEFAALFEKKLFVTAVKPVSQ